MHQFTAVGPDALYPVKESERPANALEAWGAAGLRWLGRQWRGPLWRTRRILAQVQRETQALGRLDLAAVRARADAVGFDLRCNGMTEASVARAFALIRQAGQLTLGKAHFDVQLLGGWAMLQGMVAEMKTGEGKTFTATLPAATAAMAGLPVHVITTNDYLVERDAQLMAPLYAALGLNVAWVSMEMRIPPQRELRRLRSPDRVSRSTEEKWQAVCQRTRELHARGVPVLKGNWPASASEWCPRMRNLHVPWPIPARAIDGRRGTRAMPSRLECAAASGTGL